MPLLIRSSWRFFTRHPWQLWLTLLSIALGTAVIIAVGLANQSAGQSFKQSVNVLAGQMTHNIRAQQGQLSADFYRTLRMQWGYRDSAPQIDIPIVIDGWQYRLLGVDAFATPLQLPRESGRLLTQAAQLLTQPNSVLLPQALADSLQVQSGQQLTVNINGHEQQLNIVALSNIEGMANDVLLADIATVDALQAGRGLTRIQLRLDEAQAEALQARLPANLTLESLQFKQQVFQQMTAAFSINLQAMSLLAMLVGAFLVYNTMTFSVLQRRRSFAIGRMLGVTGRQLFRHLLVEALLLGLLGSLLGTVLGIVLGQGLLVLVSQTISDLFIQIKPTDLLLSPSLFLQAIAVTLGMVLLATLAPAVEAARVSPVQVQRRSHLEQRQQQHALWLLSAGVGLAVASGLLISYSGKSLLFGFVGLFMLILGYCLIVPWLLQRSLVLLQRIPLGLTGHMVVRGVQASLSRTSLAVIALLVAVSATVGVSIMVGSFRASVADWLQATLVSDVYISARGEDSSQIDGGLHPDWLTQVQQLPEVAAWSTGTSRELVLDDFPVPALILQPAAYSADGFVWQGGDESAIWQAFVNGEGILVSEPFVYHRTKQVGDTVVVQAGLAGELSLPIIGVFQDYSSTRGMVVLPRQLYTTYWDDGYISSIGMQLHDGVDVAVFKRRLQTLAQSLRLEAEPLVIRDSREIRGFSLQVFDRTFVITNILRLLVIVVAFVGVFSALLALFLEKGREFAILRATGFTPVQVQHLVRGQALLLGLLAGALALPLGSLMSVVLIDIINQRSFGWTMQTHFFAWVPLQALVLALVAAWLASWYPVRRIAKVKVGEGLRAL